MLRTIRYQGSRTVLSRAPRIRGHRQLHVLAGIVVLAGIGVLGGPGMSARPCRAEIAAVPPSVQEPPTFPEIQLSIMVFSFISLSDPF